MFVKNLIIFLAIAVVVFGKKPKKPPSNTDTDTVTDSNTDTVTDSNTDTVTDSPSTDDVNILGNFYVTFFLNLLIFRALHIVMKLQVLIQAMQFQQMIIVEMML